jgi:hypothetical protein
VPNALPCQFAPGPLNGAICEKLNDAGALVPLPIKVAAGLPATIAEEAGDAVLSRFAAAAYASLGDSLQKAYAWMNSGTTPDFFKTWYVELFGWAFALAIAFAMPLALARSGKAAHEADAVEFVKGPSLAILLIAFGGFLPAAVGASTYFSDIFLTGQLMDRSGDDMQVIFDRMVSQIKGLESFGLATMGPVLVALTGVIGGVLLWIEFQLREYALYVVTLWTILTFALWASGKGQYERFSRAMSTLLGLIVFKFLAALMFFVSMRMMADPSDHDADPNVIGAILLIAIPVLTWTFYKAITHHDPQPGTKILVLYRFARR